MKALNHGVCHHFHNQPFRYIDKPEHRVVDNLSWLHLTYSFLSVSLCFLQRYSFLTKPTIVFSFFISRHKPPTQTFKAPYQHLWFSTSPHSPQKARQRREKKQGLPHRAGLIIIRWNYIVRECRTSRVQQPFLPVPCVPLHVQQLQSFQSCRHRW